MGRGLAACHCAVVVVVVEASAVGDDSGSADGDYSCAGGREALAVGEDVVDGVGCRGAGSRMLF
jgi:hypothetical protein